MSELKWEADPKQLADIEKRLADVAGSRMKSKFANALNKTATQMKKQLTTQAAATFTYRRKRYGSLRRVKRASPGNLEALLKSSGDTESLKDFSTKGGADGVQAAIRKGEYRLIQKYENKGFIGKGKLNRHIFVRKGSKRLPIEKIKGRSEPYMIGDRSVLEPVEPKVSSQLEKMLDSEIQRILGG